MSEDNLKYLNDVLGFSKRKIKKAWKLAQKDFPKQNKLTLEIMARDFLRDRKNYERVRDNNIFKN